MSDATFDVTILDAPRDSNWKTSQEREKAVAK